MQTAEWHGIIGFYMLTFCNMFKIKKQFFSPIRVYIHVNRIKWIINNSFD